MRFNIEGFIVFDSEEACLVNLLTGDCIELSATSTRLLASLLQYRGDIISRIDIFQTVFEQFGARASNSNLNQYISTLRRSLADLGIEKDVIITVPRIGFKISEEVIVTTDDDHHSSFTLPVISPQPPKRNFILHFRQIFSFILLFFISISVFVYLFFYKNKTGEEIIKQDECNIYIPNYVSRAEILNHIKNKPPLPSVIDCSTPKKIYFLTREVNGTQGLGTYINTFILACSFNNTQCHSYYYKEIKNA
ncbi:winged helix-turn-helix domain-containing protein [uncultured Cedecea sp.]|uniref:winged helix-turn-helix domain-containing protein n=1 Tax=uncultured Cedecea sp. TaxID=988762 RepID=UPI0026347968|nr:winged helix-turn-helix domain-containing protein [uncultured Cedecea sp.]